MRSILARSARLTAMAWLVCLAAAQGRAQDVAALRGKDAPAGAIWLDSLDVNKIEQSWAVARAGCSAESHPIQIHGVGFVHGIGTYSVSEMWIDLKGAATKFVGMVGVDDDAHGKGSVGFEVWVDGKKVVETDVMRGGNEAKMLSADLRGARRLLLRVNDGGDGTDYDRADWAGAILELAPGARHDRKPSTRPGRSDRRLPTRIRRGRPSTPRQSREPRRAVRSCSWFLPAASGRYGFRPRISPRG